MGASGFGLRRAAAALALQAATACGGQISEEATAARATGGSPGPGQGGGPAGGRPGQGTGGSLPAACHADLLSDPLNCGACSYECAAGQECVSGSCIGGSGGASGTGGTTGTGGLATGGSPACPGTGGSTMAYLPEGYCIDRIEVTRAEYAAWLGTSPSTAGQIGDCMWNTTFAPDASCLADPAVCQDRCDVHPQVCVDWCDAYAYCKAVGKRLCGRIGGGSNATDDYADVSRSQWYNACTSHGTQAYPYGNEYLARVCNTYDYWAPRHDYTTLPVAAFDECQSNIDQYANVYDLSGNAWEWEDSCEGYGESALCYLRGGAFYSTDGDCGALAIFPREVGYVSTGFRCCAP